MEHGGADLKFMEIGDGSEAGTVSSPAGTPFDESGLIRRLLGDRNLAEDIVTRFVQGFPLMMENLISRLAQGDTAQARRHAHTMKGASATVGADALREAVHQVEHAAAAAELQTAVELLPGIQTQFERFQAALERAEWR